MAPKHSVPLTLLFCTTLTLHSSHAQECYYPDGTQAADDLQMPCNSTASTGGQAVACCREGSMCTTSGLCIGQRGFFTRSACTDSSFDSPYCASICLNDPPNYYARLLYCGTYSNSTPKWCCWDQTQDTCCDESSDSSVWLSMDNFDWGDYFNPLYGEDVQGNASTSIPSSSPSTPATPRPTDALSSSPSATSTTDGSSKSGSGHSDLAVAVGLAVGIPLAGLVVLAAILVYKREKRYKGVNSGSREGVFLHSENAIRYEHSRFRSEGQTPPEQNMNMGHTVYEMSNHSDPHELYARQ